MFIYNQQFNPPTRNQAISLLKTCQPLCLRLASGDQDKIESGGKNLVALMGYQQVLLAGYTVDQEVLRLSGITALDLARLVRLLQRSTG